MQKQLSKAASMAVFLSETLAFTVGENGLGGNAPCLENYSLVAANPTIGDDPHAVHGIQAADGGFVAVGVSLEEESGGAKDGFVIKTQGGCTFPDRYSTMTETGTGCDGTWDWVTKLADDAKTDNKAIWVEQSLDNTYFIVAGLKKAEDGKSTMQISKLLETDGSIVWQHKVKDNNIIVIFLGEIMAVLSIIGYIHIVSMLLQSFFEVISNLLFIFYDKYFHIFVIFICISLLFYSYEMINKIINTVYFYLSAWTPKL